MSTGVDIFIRSTKTLEALGGELSLLLGVQFARDDHGALRFQDHDQMVVLEKHEFENHADIDMESYPFVVLLSTPRDDETEDLARKYFGLLKARTSYPLLLLRELTVKLDERS
jgi:hypothetical protein